MTRSDDKKPNRNAAEPFDDAFGEMLCAYLDDELSADQRIAVEARLESDPTARAQLDALSIAVGAVRELPRGSAPSSIIESVSAHAERAELLGKPEESVTLARHKRGPFRSTMALAAMLMVAVSASLYVSLKSQQNSAITRQTEPANGPLASKSASPRDSMLAMREDSKNRGRELFDESEMQIDADSEIGAMASKGATDERLGLRKESSNIESDDIAGRIVMDASESTRGRASGPAALSTVERELDEKRNVNEPVSTKGKSERQDVSALGPLFADAIIPQSELVPDDTETTVVSDAANAQKPPAARLAKLDAEMTFEQKLVAGADATAVTDHPFMNEPLQLSVSFENDEEQAIGEQQLQAFLGRNGMRPIAANAESYEELNDQIPSAKDFNEVAPEKIDLDDEAYYIGLSSQNYASVANSRQYLVRINSDRLGEVVNDLSTIGAEEVQMRVGNVRSENQDQLWELASQVAGEVIEPPVSVANKLIPSARTQRAKKSESQISEGAESFPETGQWIQALQAYGLLPNDDAEEMRMAGKDTLARGGFSGAGSAGGVNSWVDASTNAVPTESAPNEQPMLEKLAQKQQTLLTLVIELVNDHTPGKKEQPTKIKQ